MFLQRLAVFVLHSFKLFAFRRSSGELQKSLSSQFGSYKPAGHKGYDPNRQIQN